MPSNCVMAVGFVLTAVDANPNDIHVKTWVRLSGSQGADSHEYEHLTYLEALELIVTTSDNNRVGWQIGDGWSQPPLEIA